MGLVGSLIKPYIGAGNYLGFEKEDLFQIGCVGLIKAVKTFDVTKGYKFSSYAVPVIVGYIRRWLRDNRIVHVSRRENVLYFKINKLQKRIGRELSMKEIEKHFNVSEKEIEDCLNSMNYCISLHKVMHKGIHADSNNTELGDILPDKRGEKEIYDNLEQVEFLQHVKKLPKREQTILLLKLKGFTQEEIRKVVGLSQAHVSRLLRHAISELKKYYQEDIM